MADLRFYVLSRPKDSREDEYNDWYENQHLEEILTLPGFLAAQRFKLAGQGPGAPAPAEYLAVYEIDGDQEEAQATLAAATQDGRLNMSQALADPTMWWFESIGDRHVAAD